MRASIAIISTGKDPAAVKAAAEEEVWGFAGLIPSVEKLTWVLTTIAWTASGHHAAVNFGLHHFSAFRLLNVSVNIRRPVPKPGDVNNQAFKVRKGGPGARGKGVQLVEVFEQLNMSPWQNSNTIFSVCSCNYTVARFTWMWEGSQGIL